VPAAFTAHTRVAGAPPAAWSGSAGHRRAATFAVWPAGEHVGAGLPDLTPGAALPTCVRTVVRGETIFAI